MVYRAAQGSFLDICLLLTWFTVILIRVSTGMFFHLQYTTQKWLTRILLQVHHLLCHVLRCSLLLTLQIGRSAQLPKFNCVSPLI